MEGVHLRRSARGRSLIDPLRAAVHPAGDEFQIASPTSHPQRSTLILFDGSCDAPLNFGGLRSLPVSPAVAVAHRRLRLAHDALQIEEHVVRLVDALQSQSYDVAHEIRKTPASWQRLAEEIQCCITTHYAERLTLSGIARACRVSIFHACRVFRHVTGGTIHQHLTRTRLHVALSRVRLEQRQLTDLALEVGFASHSHFGRAFRVEFGIPPSRVSSSPK